MIARRLWLVRHGETEGQSSIRFHGSNDVELSAEGREQIRALAPLLSGIDFARVVHSPLRRAAQSAAILAELCAIPMSRLLVEPRLREISFGACEGMTEAEIRAAFPDFWRDHQAGVAPGFPGGEARAEFDARVAAATTELLTSDWRGDVLLVAHRGTVRQTMRSMLRVPAGVQDPFRVALASVSVLREENGWQLDVLGMLP